MCFLRVKGPNHKIMLCYNNFRLRKFWQLPYIPLNWKNNSRWNRLFKVEFSEITNRIRIRQAAILFSNFWVQLDLENFNCLLLMWYLHLLSSDIFIWSVLVIYFCNNVDTRYVVLCQNSSIDVIFYGLLVSFCHKNIQSRKMQWKSNKSRLTLPMIAVVTLYVFYLSRK